MSVDDLSILLHLVCRGGWRGRGVVATLAKIYWCGGERTSIGWQHKDVTR